MKLNIFSVLPEEIARLRDKLESVEMSVIASGSQDGWEYQLYYSPGESGRQVPWVKHLEKYFESTVIPESKSPFAVFLFTKADKCFAISYGKSHFYIRPLCDYDFGIDLAKRIAREDDIRQTSSQRFTGRQRKSIRSFSEETQLSVESGESVDYIRAGILNEHITRFGKMGQFGSSAQLTVEIGPDEIGTLLNDIEHVLTESEKFKLPRTTRLTEADEIEKFEEKLLDALEGKSSGTEFAENSYDLYGVDFVFAGIGSYTIKHKSKTQPVQELALENLQDFIRRNSIHRDQIFSIRIVHERDGNPAYTNELKRDLEFVADDDDRVALNNGRWVRFNQDYLDFLDSFVANIEVEPTEEDFSEVKGREDEFTKMCANKWGYELADKDFEIFRTRSSTSVEAWDLKRDSTVYAVKFGSAQKLSYVCDQAMNIVNLLGNRANRDTIPDFDRYCLWLGYESKLGLTSIEQSRSIILKQKIEAWARAAKNLGITPVIKLSRKDPRPKSRVKNTESSDDS
ncbi:sporadically distributed protein, TIGR04141 family [Actinopolyspora alba]|uniref:Sporadically distributed protein, TIGR04141 family n=1 Tax=Actinopolyspora alba TaxID=673379 RepID=A0A1I1YU42_9ACTN|nr:DUF6119 family protein [Actinopolyspora alba]SFE23114.1 sporadically distributed protein, TIGR04141 family [Actinopolyspora alba]